MGLGVRAFCWFIVGWSFCLGSAPAIATDPCEPALDSGFFVGVSKQSVFSSRERVELISALNELYDLTPRLSFGSFYTKTVQLAHGLIWFKKQRIHYSCTDTCGPESLKPFVRKALGHITRVLADKTNGRFVSFLNKKRVFSVTSIRYYLSTPTTNGLPAHRDGQVFQGVILLGKSPDLIGGNLFVQTLHPTNSIPEFIDQGKFETVVFGGVSNWHGVGPMEVNSQTYPVIARDVVSIGFNVGVDDDHAQLPKGYRVQ